MRDVAGSGRSDTDERSEALGDDDAALVSRAKRDRAAFAPLYRRYVGPVYRYCSYRLRTKEEAEDATSLVFAKALAALPTCRDDAFRSWLFRIAHNVVGDAYRRARPTEPLDIASEVVDPDELLEDVALATDRRRTLRSLLVQLPVEQRRVVELRLAGLTGAEIAEVTGRAHPAVRMLQTRAMARLRVLHDASTELDEDRHDRD